MRIDKTRARQAFSRAAATYDQAAVLQREIGQRLLARLDYVKLQPKRVLDIGCGTGQQTADLLQRYPQAQVIGLDFALPMVQRTQQRGRWWRHPQGICADLEQLPLAAQSIDLIVSSAALQWCDDPQVAFMEMQRVLRPGGLVMFTTFGPDTLCELRQAWAQIDTQPHVHAFLDMHEYGDALVRARFADPVLDCETLTLTYPRVRDLLAELKTLGATNADPQRNRGLTGRAHLAALSQAYAAYQQPDGTFPATYEVVYGHAWAVDQTAATAVSGETRVSVEAVRAAM